MKRSLVSATSLAGLLALNAGPAGAATFTLSPSTLNFGNTLVNCAAFGAVCVVNTLTETATRSATGGTDNITFNAPTAGTAYTGGGSGTFANPAGSTVTSTYTCSPAVTGSTGANASQSITVTSGGNKLPFTVKGTGVAPIELTSITNAAGTGGGTANTGSLGNILVHQTATATVTVQNTGNGNTDTRQTSPGISNLKGTQSFTGSVAFSGPNGIAINLPDAGSNTFTYTYAPTIRSNGVTQSITATSAFTDGSKNGKNLSETVNTTISGTAVAPVNSVTPPAATTFARFSTAGTSTSTASVIVKNTGDGNKAGADNGTTFLSNLHGSLGSPAPSTVFAGAGGLVNLPDGQSATFSYSYAPTARGTNSATVTATFSNGSSDGKNDGQVVNATLNGQGVGPTYQSRLGTTAANAPSGTINTPPANTGSSVVDFGAVSAFSHNTLYLDLANISSDPGGAALTDLTMLSVSISGASAFGLTGFSPGALLHEGQDVVLPITFDPGGAGSYIATLEFFTDEGAPLGVVGDSFSYTLSGSATAVPEPGSLLLLSAGLGGLFAVRRWRRQPH